ncbi:MAG: nuclear transport factor 2 family protein [Candidatus Kapabacteria bacterium]|nr:nuclear transport factor 2 family protein [Candidatus Kapabacteria bacterium]
MANPDFSVLFNGIDAKDHNVFRDFLTEDAQFRFANHPAVVGREAIVSFLEGWFQSIAGIKHSELTVRHGEGFALTEGIVTYTRHSGSLLAVPFANVFNMVDGKIKDYLIYVDNSTLYSEA